MKIPKVNKLNGETMSKVNNVVENKDRLCQHLRSIGIPQREAARYASRVDKWLTRSGPEWTTARLKSLKVAFSAHLSKGDQVKLDYPIAEGWGCRKSKRGKVIYDDGLVHEMFLDCHNPKKLKRAIAFLDSYKVIIAEKHTARMKRDFRKSVTTGFEEGGGNSNTLQEYNTAVFNIVKQWPRYTRQDKASVDSKVVPLAYLQPTKSKFSPVFKMFLTEAGGPIRKVRSESRTNIETKQFVEMFWQDQKLRDIWKKYPAKVSKALTGVDTMPYLDYTGRLEKNYSYFPGYVGNRLPYGTIGFIMEGGWKNRAVASVSLPIQALAEELKQKLHRLSSKRKTVYTDDQAEAQMRISDWLGAGKTVYCFDGSAFTDRFPYETQRQLMLGLKELGWVNDFDISVIDAVVDSEFKLPGKSKKDEFVKYKVGQPMGLGPSFHLFCLTHNAIVESIALDLGITNYEEHFCIVGDDIVISDGQIAEKYSQVIQDLGVKINMAKSMISSHYGEFCGKVISSLGVTPSMKVKPITNVDQLVRCLEFYGKEAHAYLSDRERAWFIKAFLPRELGGLSFTPHGMTYKKYLSHLMLDKIRDDLIYRDVMDVIQPVSSGTVETHLLRTQEFFDNCVLGGGFSRLWLDHSGIKAAVNELTGLPVSPSNTRQSIVERRWREATSKPVRRESKCKRTQDLYEKSYRQLGQTTRDLRSLTTLITDATTSDVKAYLDEAYRNKGVDLAGKRYIIKLAIQCDCINKFGYVPSSVAKVFNEHPLWALDKNKVALDRQRPVTSDQKTESKNDQINGEKDDSSAREANELRRARSYLKAGEDNSQGEGKPGENQGVLAFVERLQRAAEQAEQSARRKAKQNSQKGKTQSKDQGPRKQRKPSNRP